MPDDDDEDSAARARAAIEKELELWPKPAAAEGADLDCWSPAVPAAMVLLAERHSPTIAAAIARGRERPHLIVIDRPAPRAPEEGLGEVFEIGLPMPAVPYRRVDVQVPARSEPWVAAPVRLSDCPSCAAKAGERCVGFDRWDECHPERLFACLAREDQP